MPKTADYTPRMFVGTNILMTDAERMDRCLTRANQHRPGVVKPYTEEEKRLLGLRHKGRELKAVLDQRDQDVAAYTKYGARKVTRASFINDAIRVALDLEEARQPTAQAA